ncbi:MAG: tetratricopeptide repeat protein [Thermodesulfobacteriota bacterium]
MTDGTVDAPPAADPIVEAAKADLAAGQAFLAKNNLGQAASALDQALRGYRQAGDHAGIANVLVRLAEVATRGGQHDQALEHLQQALRICAAEKDAMSCLYVQQRQAACLRALDRTAEATAVYLEMLDTHSGHNNPGGAVEVLVSLAETYAEAGDTAKAADAYRTAASIHRNFRHQRTAEELLQRAAALETGAWAPPVPGT